MRLSSVVVVVTTSALAEALVLPRRLLTRRWSATTAGTTTTEQAETGVLNLLGTGRISLSSDEEAELNALVAVLAGSGGPASADKLDGTWVLLYTTKSEFDVKNPLGRRVDGTAPGVEAVFDKMFANSENAAPSSSPIQRALTSIEAVRIEQNIDVSSPDKRVDQWVRLNDNLALRLSAEAQLEETTGRINFTFDLAYFDAFNFRLPYPVPFRLLGDEAKGYLDTLYVSPRLRISRGNKGTTFILARQ